MREQQFQIKLADLIISVSCKKKTSKEFAREYLVRDSQADFETVITEEELKKEKLKNPQFSIEYLETLCMYRKIAEELPRYNRILIHGAAIKYDGGAYLFCAPSGTGKSTLIREWKRYLGKEVDIINGDKPILAIGENEVTVYGTPWAGKEGWQKNQSALLQGICFIKQGDYNRIRHLDINEKIEKILKHIYLTEDAINTKKSLIMVEELIKNIPMYELECDVSEKAVRCSYEMMTGKSMGLREKCIVNSEII